MRCFRSEPTRLRLSRSSTNQHTHTHTFNGPLSGTTRVSRYQKGKTNLDFTEARDSEWQWHQLGHTQVCISLQTDNHASTPPLVFYRPDALPATQPTASQHWRHSSTNTHTAFQWRSQKFSTGSASICSIPFCPFPFSCPTKSAVQSKNVTTYHTAWMIERTIINSDITKSNTKKLCIFLTGGEYAPYATCMGMPLQHSRYNKLQTSACSLLHITEKTRNNNYRRLGLFTACVGKTYTHSVSIIKNSKNKMWIKLKIFMRYK